MSLSLKMNKSTDLTGKVALVTGGGTGVGLMIAKGLASNGAKVYITGRRLNVLRQAAEEKFESAGHLIPLQMDVTVKESIISVVDHVKKSDGKLDILVNNAATDGPKIRSSYTDTPASDQSFGAYAHHLFDIQSFEDWGSLAQTNVASYFFVTMAFVDLLVESTQGKEGATASVINVTSGAGQIRLSFGYFAYASLKAGTSHLTRLLATDFALKRAPIRVNAIAPGTFPSQLSAPKDQLDEYCKTNMGCLEPIPARRPGREYEMAALAVYLASPASGYTHGQEIFIDGGLLSVNP
ncbi:hypothetical protein ACEPAH_3556 [Sanghuangporus vaninii]